MPPRELEQGPGCKPDSARERIRSIALVAFDRIAAVTSPAYDLGITEEELRARHPERLNGTAMPDHAAFGGPRLAVTSRRPSGKFGLPTRASNPFGTKSR